MQESQPLGRPLASEKIDARRVTLRPSEARHKAEFDRVFTHTEDNRYRRRRSFGCEGAGRTARRRDDRHTTADEIGCQGPKTVVLTFRPAIFDCNVLPFDKTEFV